MGLLADFGQEVKARRERLGISQEKLAEKTGLHRTYIGMIERGERNVTLNKIGLISEALDTNMSEIFKNVEQKQ
jgi:transcriptional regulator with XRE-family HTH domain